MSSVDQMEQDQIHSVHELFTPVLSEEVLAKTSKILFVTQLAIGDFAYLQNQFAAFKKKYPWIAIDIWVDDLRRTWCFWRWKYLKKYVVYDWVEGAGLFNKVYKESYAWPLFYKSIKEAAKQEYPIVVFIGMMRPHQYVSYLRKMSPHGYLVSLVHPDKSYRSYKQLDAKIPFDLNKEKQTKHITQIFADWFTKLCGLRIPIEERKPFVKLSNAWQSYGKLKLLQWRVMQGGVKVCPLVFLNAFAKSSKRCWPIEWVGELIVLLRKEVVALENAKFVINALPEEVGVVEKMLAQQQLYGVEIFTAQENFFQLPAILALADLVISVDTSIVHLATAFERPLVVLMRTKQCEWKPQDTIHTEVIIAANGGRVFDIKVSTVLESTKKLVHRTLGW